MPVIEELKRIQKQIDRTEAWEQRGQFKGVRSYRSIGAALGAGVYVGLGFDTDVYDFGAPFATDMHYTTTTLLTGTVSTVIGGTTLAGVGTLFTTELSVGMYIRVAGTLEINTVTAITNNTTATVHLAWTAAAAGAQCFIRSEGFVIPGRGVYGISANVEYDSVGYLGITCNLRTGSPIAYPTTEWIARTGSVLQPCAYAEILCDQYDWINVIGMIVAGGNILFRENVSPVISISRIS